MSASRAVAPWRIVAAEFEAAALERAQLPPPGDVEIAFAGRSNVGKSSLMNALMDRKRLVRTSATPGCTRGIVFFAVRARDGAAFRLVDLPGYGYAKRSKAETSTWGPLIEGYLADREVLRGIVLLVDARRGFTESDHQLAELARPDVRLVVVATKIDKVPKSRRRATLLALRAASGPAIGASAVTGEGVEEIWRAIRRATPTT